ncbi:MAG: sulfatase-like hydrolase/transferase [Holophagales bacterium]|nr:sulfatase-like hydrolase/transferase [Holophagales bacterium]MYH24234.1 sulfatase-like hydrolase/transferase [Holophagales bacterium]
MRSVSGAGCSAVLRVLLPASALALVLAACGPEPEDAAPPSVQADVEHLLGGASTERPPVILITIDTLRADRLSSYGSDRVATPHIDRLAAEGVRFANASSTVPFTLPAHSSIMTGLYPPSHGVRENVGYVLAPELVTIAERFRDAGYRTGGFVSAFVLDARWGIARGFDTYVDDFDLDAMAGANLGSVQRAGPETIGHALTWLDGGGGEGPFFMWLHLFDPHDPYEPPEPFRSEYEGRPYDGEVAYTDSLIGEFRSALEQRGLFDEAVVVLTADHGEGLGDHGESYHGFFVYDSTVHVPLIVRLPGGVESGRVVTDAVSHVDIAPTLIELLELDGTGAAQGRSLLPDMQGLPNTLAERGVYAESFYALDHYGWAPLRSLRTADYKYIETPDPELYSLLEDPGELTNVLLERREVSRELRIAALELAAELDSAAPEAAPEPDLDEEALAQLRALGYLAGRGGAERNSSDGPRADPKTKAHLHRAIMRAQSAFGSGDDEAAADELRAALSEDEGLLDAHQLLGTITLLAGDPEPAIGHFQSALALDPEHRQSLLGLANAYGELGRIDEAVVGYRRLLDVAGQDSKATMALARIHVDRGELSQAEEVLAAATEGREPPPVVTNKLGEVMALLGRRGEAETKFRQALASNPELGEAHYNLAVILDEAGKPLEAVATYERAAELRPRDHRPRFNLGRLHGRLNQPREEIEAYRDAVEAAPDFARGYFHLAKALMDQGGDLGEAESIARKGLDLEPTGRDGALGYFVLADILNRLGRPAEERQAVARGQELLADG